MRRPPAVSVVCGSDPAWRALQALLGGCAAAVAGAWIGLTFSGIAAGIGAALASALVGAALMWCLSAGQVAQCLAWTGTDWRLSSGADAEGHAVHAPAVMMDLGPWMLLRVSSPLGAGRAWLSLSRRAAGPSWHLFRAAVYSSATVPSPLPSEQSPPF